MTKIGLALEKVLVGKKITQSEICSKVGITQGFFSGIKTGKKIGSEETIQAIIDVLVLTKDEESEVWKAWSYDRGHKETMEYFFKLEQENLKLKKILKEIKDI
ncbi:helix-turn-helix domain-containing protein [Cetobacterium sp.]|uniref:helix-turn-helix domain-containing protein n=1 Tax=Cetobacterium sp. TaxID=2071632 RepID=UPI003EE76C41